MDDWWLKRKSEKNTLTEKIISIINTIGDNQADVNLINFFITKAVKMIC